MKSSRAWKILFALLIVANGVTLRYLIFARRDFNSAAEVAAEGRRIDARAAALTDYKAGIYRHYRLEVVPTGPSHFVGQRDGPFEVWTWPVFWRDSKKTDLTLTSAYVVTYNSRMDFLVAQSGENVLSNKN